MKVHPSLVASSATGVTLAVLSTVTDLPGWLWATWAALTGVAAVQAVRSRDHGTR